MEVKNVVGAKANNKSQIDRGRGVGIWWLVDGGISSEDR